MGDKDLLSRPGLAGVGWGGDGFMLSKFEATWVLLYTLSLNMTV